MDEYERYEEKLKAAYEVRFKSKLAFRYKSAKPIVSFFINFALRAHLKLLIP